MFLLLCILLAGILIFVPWGLREFLGDINTNKEKQINCALIFFTFSIIFFYILHLSPDLLLHPIFAIIVTLIITCFVYPIIYIIYKIVQSFIDK